MKVSGSVRVVPAWPGSVSQLVLSVAGPTPRPLWPYGPGRLWLCHNSHTSTASVHTSPQTYTWLTRPRWRQPFRSPFARTHARTAGIDQPSLRTSVDDGAAVVEDDSALVQGGDGVEEVEGPQIPLKTPTKDSFTLTLSLSFVSAKSAVNLITQ